MWFFFVLRKDYIRETLKQKSTIFRAKERMTIGILNGKMGVLLLVWELHTRPDKGARPNPVNWKW